MFVPKDNGPFMNIAFHVPILWGNLVKHFVDGLEESSVYFFHHKKSTRAKNQSVGEEVKLEALT